MDCLIIYSRDGEKRFQNITTRLIPNMKAVEFTVLNAELPQQHNRFDATLSVRERIEQLGIEILDVIPVQRQPLPRTAC